VQLSSSQYSYLSSLLHHLATDILAIGIATVVAVDILAANTEVVEVARTMVRVVAGTEVLVVIEQALALV
jgi:selenophosphate synthetase-related protein